MAYLLSRGRGDFTSNYMAIMPKDKFIVLIVRFHHGFLRVLSVIVVLSQSLFVI